ncbi:MAG: hypothetical protein RJB13_843 [Pseudomonadota bacterium]
MKTVLVTFSGILVSCGQNLQTEELILVRAVGNDSPSSYEQGEDLLGIGSKKKDQQGALKSLSKKKGGEPAKVDQAFGSYTQFVSTTINSRCAGVFSYEPIVGSPDTVNVHFNTAVHCFEKVNPLGMAEIPLSKSNVKVGSSAAPPESFVRPFQASNKVKKSVTFSKAEVLVDRSGKATDAIRLFVSQLPLAEAQKAYLPTCDGFSSQAKEQSLHAMGWSSSSESPFVATVSLEELQGLPQFLLDMFSLAGEAPQVTRLSGVTSFPGESGGPVFQVDGREDVDRINGYECVRGVISREVAEPNLPSSQEGGSVNLNINSYFTPITARSMGGQWKELK